LRKQLLATTTERYINIWNYEEKTLEISHVCQPGDDVAAVAFHPSGFHIIVAYPDKVQIMNVLSNSLKESAPVLSLKGCKEIKFSNGGHLFAASVGQGGINIYNFYT
jgi:cilia- and flagella-associated protein 57